MSLPNSMKRAIVKATKADHSSPSKNLIPHLGATPEWDTLFDGKFVLAYTGQQERICELKKEFERVGMTGVEVAWNTDDKFAMDFLNNQEGTSTQFRFFNNGLGHYRIIKGAYQRGFEHIIVMEDDIKFLRDTDEIQRILADLPSDYEVALLDSHGEVKDRDGSHWRIITSKRTSAGCYALSRDGMAKMIAYYETSPFEYSDEGFTLEHFDKPYFCYPLIARQVPGGWWRSIYDSSGTKEEDYGL